MGGGAGQLDGNLFPGLGSPPDLFLDQSDLRLKALGRLFLYRNLKLLLVNLRLNHRQLFPRLRNFNLLKLLFPT